MLTMMMTMMIMITKMTTMLGVTIMMVEVEEVWWRRKIDDRWAPSSSHPLNVVALTARLRMLAG